DPDIIGKPLQLADATATIVGVMPPEFTHPSRSVGIWHAARESNLTANMGAYLNARYGHVVGRLREGGTAEPLSAQLDAMSAGLRAEHGIESSWRVGTVSLLEQAVGDVRGALFGAFVVSLVVLAIACATSGALLAARLAARGRELAVMQALGATPGRV